MNRCVVQFSADATVEGNTIKGMAHVYGTRALVKGGYEQIRKGAFDKALKNSDVRAFLQHDQSKLLGRQSSGTLRLDASGDGLAYELDLPNTTYAQDLKELINRGDLTEMSFGFIPGEVSLSKHSDGIQIREHLEVKELVDVSPVSIPAFANTSIVMRSKSYDDENIKSQTIRARHRAMKT